MKEFGLRPCDLTLIDGCSVQFNLQQSAAWKLTWLQFVLVVLQNISCRFCPEGKTPSELFPFLSPPPDLFRTKGHHLYGNLHNKSVFFFELPIVHDCFYTECENVILLFVRMRSIFPNVHTSTSQDGCAEQPSPVSPSPTTTSPTCAEKLMICAFQHQTHTSPVNILKHTCNPLSPSFNSSTRR